MILAVKQCILLFDSDNDDPFAFQGVGTAAISDNDLNSVSINANLLNKDNNNKFNTAGQNNQPKATRNNKGHDFPSIVLQGNFINQNQASGQNPSLDQPLVSGYFQDSTITNTDVFNQPGAGVATGLAGRLATTRLPPRTQTTQSATRRPENKLITKSTTQRI